MCFVVFILCESVKKIVSFTCYMGDNMFGSGKKRRNKTMERILVRLRHIIRREELWKCMPLRICKTTGNERTFWSRWKKESGTIRRPRSWQPGYEKNVHVYRPPCFTRQKLSLLGFSWILGLLFLRNFWLVDHGNFCFIACFFVWADWLVV
jgi:hypothetical protein